MFYEKDRRLGELNEKIKRKAHVKQSFSLDFLERGTFTEYPIVEKKKRYCKNKLYDTRVS